MSNSPMILEDFNSTLIEKDRCGKTVNTYDKGYNALFEFMNKHTVEAFIKEKYKTIFDIADNTSTYTCRCKHGKYF